MLSSFRPNRSGSNALRRRLAALAVTVTAATTLVAGGPARVHALEGAWTHLNPETPPRVTSADLFGVDFISDSTGIIVGDGGTIFRTTDRGATWIAAASGTGEALNAVQIIDATTAVAVGSGGAIIRSIDGGVTWSPQTSGTTEDLADVHFIDVLTGWAVGSAGTLVRTTDGGTSWNAGNSRTTLDLTGVDFVDAQKGYAVGGKGMIMQSFDGGASWIHKPDGVVCYNDHGVLQCNSFHDVYFLDASRGFAVGYPAYPVLLEGGAFFKTLNGGTSWVSQAPAPQYFDIEAFRAIAFGNSTDGLILTYWTGAFSTDDAGASWTETTIPTTRQLNAIAYGDSDTAYAVGKLGTIMRWDRNPQTPTQKHTWGSIKSIFGD